MPTAYDYYPVALAVIDRISQGATQTTACHENGCTVAWFKKFVAADRQLVEMLEEADQLGYDALADALLSPENHDLYGTTDPKMAKIFSDNIKWLLAHRDKKRFGDVLEVKHEHTIAFAITDALEQAQLRVTDGMKMIDITPNARPLPPPMDDEDALILAQLMS